MKANEIQIGDFVFVNGTPCKVCAITKKKIGYHREESLDRTRMYYAVLQEVTPIHIYPEILEKNGFIPHTTWFDFTDDDLHIEINNGLMKFWFDWEPGNDGTYCDYLLPYPTYVNELQHGLRFLGLYDLVDNFKV